MHPRLQPHARVAATVCLQPDVRRLTQPECVYGTSPLTLTLTLTPTLTPTLTLTLTPTLTLPLTTLSTTGASRRLMHRRGGRAHRPPLRALQPVPGGGRALPGGARRAHGLPRHRLGGGEEPTRARPSGSRSRRSRSRRRRRRRRRSSSRRRCRGVRTVFPEHSTGAMHTHHTLQVLRDAQSIGAARGLAFLYLRNVRRN
jgi:hypothetical protein